MSEGRLAIAPKATELMGKFADTHLTNANQFAATIERVNGLVKQHTGDLVSAGTTVFEAIQENVVPKLMNLASLVQKLAAKPIDQVRGLAVGMRVHFSGGAEEGTTTLPQAVGTNGKSTGGRGA